MSEHRHLFQSTPRSPQDKIYVSHHSRSPPNPLQYHRRSCQPEILLVDPQTRMRSSFSSLACLLCRRPAAPIAAIMIMASSFILLNRIRNYLVNFFRTPSRCSATEKIASIAGPQGLIWHASHVWLCLTKKQLDGQLFSCPSVCEQLLAEGPQPY